MGALPNTVDGINTNIDFVDDAVDWVDIQVTNAQTAVTNATTQVGLAAIQVGLASDQRVLAQSAATTAINAPGTSATSSTSTSIGTGSRNLTIQTGKLFVPGQPIMCARTSAPSTTRMYGTVDSYNTGTGVIAFTVPVGGTWGSGTYSDWTVSLTGPRSDVSSSVIPVSGTTQTAVSGGVYRLDSASASTVTLPASPSDGDTVTIYIGSTNGRYDNTVARNGKTIMGLSEDMVLDDPFTPWKFIYIASTGDWRFAA